MLKNPLHKKSNAESSAAENASASEAVNPEDTASAQTADSTATAHDVETENLKNAIAQVMAEETVVLPHIEQLSSSVTKESGLADNETAEQEPEISEASDAEKPPAIPDSQAKISSWFVTFMAMRIPVAGWIYLLYLAFSKNTTNRRNFARAYLLCKLIFLVLGLIILLIIISAAMNILQDLLDYMAML